MECSCLARRAWGRSQAAVAGSAAGNHGKAMDGTADAPHFPHAMLRGQKRQTDDVSRKLMRYQGLHTHPSRPDLNPPSGAPAPGMPRW